MRWALNQIIYSIVCMVFKEASFISLGGNVLKRKVISEEQHGANKDGGCIIRILVYHLSPQEENSGKVQCIVLKFGLH